jgi:hypothetical protein
MGYYTYFTLNKIHGSDEDYDALVKDIDEKTGIDFSRDNCQEAKWYDSHEDMTELTKKYPDLTVQLDGDGENSDDLWACRYRGGESEQIEAAMPAFCEIATPAERASFVANTYEAARKGFIRLIRRIVQEKGGDVETDIVLEEDTVSVSRCTRLRNEEGELRYEHAIEMKDGSSRIGGWCRAQEEITLQQAFAVAKALLKEDEK